jgi:mono/diheme cytochrome c family protein
MNFTTFWFTSAVLLTLGIETFASAASAPSFSAAQAASGAKAYQADCSQCHGAQLQGISAPALKGPSMKGTRKISELYAFITQQMPAGAPGSLSPSTYVSIVAFLLKENGDKPGPTALTPASVRKIDATI